MSAREESGGFIDLFSPLTTRKIIVFLICIGLFVYFNSLFNGLVLEDRVEIVRNPSIWNIQNIPNLFVSQVGGQETIGYYRPLVFGIYALIYSLFATAPFPYHLMQLVFEIASSCMVFLVLRKYIKKEISFFLAVLFLVHPVNEEAVAWVSLFQDPVYLFFGLLAIYVLQNNRDKVRDFILVNAFLLLSLFAKESGVLFLILAFVYVFLLNRKNLLIYSILSFFTALFYIALRFSSRIPIQKVPLIPIMKLTLAERLTNIPAIIFYYIKTFLYPADLSVYHSWVIRDMNLNSFLVPLILDLIFFTLLAAIFVKAYKASKNSKELIFFSVWLVVGLAFYLQIIPLDFTVAEHFFLVPFVGLAGLVGLSLQNIRVSKSTKSVGLYIAIFILVALGVRTMIRNTNWQSQLTILKHDEKSSGGDYLIELVYSTSLIEDNKPDEAMPRVRRALTLYPESWFAWDNLGAVYYEKGDIKDAKNAYLHSIAISKSFNAYENLGLLIKSTEPPSSSIKFLRQATQMFPTSAKLWYYRFIVAYKLKNRDEELLSAKNYFLLKRDDESYAIYNQLLQNKPIVIN
ncbi:MAG TPA: hypothetical protein VG965_02105 [Patescibacteria group bacterium]|nr:hypothetical protein [Patescibacteria group bacterium]